MTSALLYLDLVTKSVQSSTTGPAPPAITVALGEFLALNVAFMREAVTEALANNTPVAFVVKPKGSQDAAPLAIDIVADVSGVDGARRYLLKAQIDCADLRTALAGKESDKFMVQVTKGTYGQEDWFVSNPLPITVLNSYVRGSDAAPSALGDAGWNYLKQSFPASATVTHHDDTKTITVSGTGGEGGSGAPGADGKSVELRANSTHIQWRLVGNTQWIDLVALSTLKGADGTNGTNGTNGTVFRFGSSEPSNSVGVNGDFYMFTANNVTVLHEKVSGQYVWVANLTGAQGPAGTGGSGGGLLKVSATVKGNDAYGAVGSNAALTIDTSNWTDSNLGTLNIEVNGDTPVALVIENTGTGHSGLSIDTQALMNSQSALAAAIANALTTLAISGLSVSTDSNTTIYLSNAVQTSESTIDLSTDCGGIAFPDGTSSAGSAPTSNSGAITEAIAAAGVSGKHIRILGAYINGSLDVTVSAAIGSSVVFSGVAADGSIHQLEPGENIDTWFGGADGASLVVTTEGTPVEFSGQAATVTFLIAQD